MIETKRDDSELIKEKNISPKNINFTSEVDKVRQRKDHLGAVAWFFAWSAILSNVENSIVEKVDIWRQPPVWVDPRGGVHIINENNIIKPFMQIKETKKNDTETKLHELIHSYTHPYLFAWEQQKLWNINITNDAQRTRAVEHFDSIKLLYNEAVGNWYTAINGTSIEDNMSEFIANLTNAWSVEQLKKLNIYDRLTAELKKHINSISSLEIPYTVVVKNTA